jgi:hypothetical protein
MALIPFRPLIPLEASAPGSVPEARLCVLTPAPRQAFGSFAGLFGNETGWPHPSAPPPPAADQR